MTIEFRADAKPSLAAITALYRAVGWSAANTPDALLSALLASHSLRTAWDNDQLVGVGTAISDGHLVVFFPHLVVHPEYQGRGVGSGLMHRMLLRYRDFHEQALLADRKAIGFYEKFGFTRAGSTEGMWIFAGHEHD